MSSAIPYRFVILCAVLLLFGGSLYSGETHEVSMTHEQNAQSEEQSTRKTIDRFNEAFNRHDADALATVLTDDTVFEDTSPPPTDGALRGSPQWSSSGVDGSHATQTHSSTPRM